MDIIEARSIHLPRIAELKHAMFQAGGKGHLLAEDFVPLVLADYQELYGSSKARHLLAVEGGQIRSMAGGFIKDDIPYRYFKQARYGFLGDVYTLPSSRDLGLAAKLSGLVLDWLRQEGVDMVRLLASEAARPIYQRLGFQDTNEMVLVLSSGDRQGFS
ncbi:MAG: GNAT family N-acetyltransferase [Geminicoccaceae bacterium]